MIQQQGLWGLRLAVFKSWKGEVDRELDLSHQDVIDAELRLAATPRITDRLTGFIDQTQRTDIFSFSAPAAPKRSPRKKLKARDLLVTFPPGRGVST